MDKESSSQPKVESEVWNAIAAFEQILEAIPNDRVALETLFDAYEQIGDKTRAIDYLLKLAHSVAEEGDLEAAPDLVNKLNKYAADSPDIKEVLNQLERLLVQKKMPGGATSAGDGGKRKTVDITNELALAWNLLQAGELTQEEYSNVVHDLSENSSKNIQVPVSVLHVLHDRGYKNQERILKFLAKDSGLPFISLTAFDLPKEAGSILPLPVCMHQGAIVFDSMGGDLLVALLNPYDTSLKAEVKRLTGKPCHFYISSAEEYDQTLERIKKLLQDEKARSAS